MKQFTVAAGTSNSFNGVAVPTFEISKEDRAKKDTLVDFQDVLTGLTQSANRDAVHMHGLSAHYKPEARQQSAFSMLEGREDMLAVCVLETAGPDKQPSYLYVIEDRVRKKLIAVGKEKITPELAGELASGGLEYVDATVPNAESAINTFLRSLAEHQHSKGKLTQDFSEKVAEKIIRAVGLTTLVVITAGITTGEVVKEIFEHKKSPSTYTSIRKP